MTREESLAKAIKELMYQEPFYGLFLIMLNKKWTNHIPTAGVSKNGINYQIAINENFWNRLSPEHKVGVIKHEALHIAFFHLSIRDKYDDKMLFNMAADMEVNQYIDKSFLPGAEMTKDQHEAFVKSILDNIQADIGSNSITSEEANKRMAEIPGRLVTIEDYPELNLDLKAGTDYYYKALQQALKDNTSPGLSSFMEGLRSQDPGNGQGMHQTWEEFDGMSEAEGNLLDRQLAQNLKGIAEQIKKGSRGTIPGEIATILSSLPDDEPPKFDWRGYLRRFTGGSTKIYTKKTRKKESRRFPGNPGLRIKQKKHVLVAVDTSGSYSNDELVEAFKEIDHIHRTGAEVTIVQCDATIRSITPYKSGEDIKIKGRGGTDFQPVINYYNENSSKYSCLIYLTDGEAPDPQPGAKGRMLWVISSVSNINERLTGPQIKLN